jgi:hypothetical protein
MTLAELLSELRINLLRDDSDLFSGPNDKLWTDETLVRYINDAQRRFARRTLTLRDASTPEVVEVQLAAGVSVYTLHKSVRAVASARYDVDTADLQRAGHSILNETSDYDTTPYFDVNTMQQMAGRPLAYATDETMDAGDDSAVTLRVFPTPTATEDGKIVYLRVARMPLRDMTLDDPDVPLEVPEDYHLDLLEWVAYRAFRTADLDGASDKAKQHEDRFNVVMGEALNEQRRKMLARIGWNFGRAGFSWSP